MKELFSYQTLAWIAGIEFFILLVQFLNWVRRPLTESEIEARKQKARVENIERENHFKKLDEQENSIRNLKRPVTFVSLDGDNFRGRTLCVQDGAGNPCSFYASDWDRENSAPLFNALFNASLHPHSNGERGAVIFK